MKNKNILLIASIAASSLLFTACSNHDRETGNDQGSAASQLEGNTNNNNGASGGGEHTNMDTVPNSAGTNTGNTGVGDGTGASGSGSPQTTGPHNH